MATAQNGWPASSSKAAIGVDAGFEVAGVRFPGGVKSGDVSTVLRYVAEQFHRRVEPLHDGWCWGFNYRPITQGRGLSNHAAACAIDINAPRHPYKARGTFNTTQRAQIHAILDECDRVVRWGGDYTSTPDEMHFEIVDTPAAVAAVAARLRSGTTAPTVGGTAPPGALQHGSTGDRVARLQRVLNAWYPSLHLEVDGIYGPATAAAVKQLQQRARITVDGIAGPQTLGFLGLE